MRRKKLKNKTRQISLRLSEKEVIAIDKRAKLANKNRSKFLTDCALQNEITVVNFPDAKDIARRLTEVSSALNNLKILVHQGKVQTANMHNCTEEVSKIWQSLNSLTSQTEVIKE